MWREGESLSEAVVSLAMLSKRLQSSMWQEGDSLSEAVVLVLPCSVPHPLKQEGETLSEATALIRDALDTGILSILIFINGRILKWSDICSRLFFNWKTLIKVNKNAVIRIF